MSASNGRLGRVVLRGANSATEVYLVNSVFALEKSALRQLDVSVEPGVYKARFQLGSEIQDERFEVEPGATVEIAGKPMTVISAAPLEGTRWPADNVPSNVRALWHAASRVEGEGDGVVSVLLRGDGPIPQPPIELIPPGETKPRALPWQEVAGWQVASLRLPAGTCVLAMTEGGSRLCRTLPVLAGQQTALAVRLSPEKNTGDEELGALLRSALLISPFPIAGGEEELLHQIVAQQVLQRSRALERPSAEDEASFSPLALLLRAHGVLEARRKKLSHPLDPLQLPDGDREQVKAAYERLRSTGLARSADVEALAMAVEAPSQPVDLDVPPLLASTWRTLVTASLTGRQVQGGLRALRMAEGMMASSLWLTWEAREAASPGEGGLSAAVRDLLEPELRPSSARLPSWVESPKLLGLARNHTGMLARGLQLPISLLQELVRNLKDDRANARRERAGRRISALRSGTAKVCLVVLPDSIRIDPGRGQPLDLDAVMDELVGDAAERAGLVAVRAPPVGVASAEMQETLTRANALVVDTTFADPVAENAAGFWLARSGRSPVYLRAEGFPAGAHPGETVFPYSATFGTGVSFPDAGRVAQALEDSAALATPSGEPERRQWLERLARLEEQQLELQDLAARVQELDMQRKRPEAAALLQAELPAETVRAWPSSLQLAAFLLSRAIKDGTGMERIAGLMRPELRASLVVREQLALALKWSKQPERMMEGARLLAEVLEQVGFNGETCGLLGGIYKELWRMGAGGPEEAKKRLERAIDCYRRGLGSSPQDPYPGVNLLTVLVADGTPDAMAEHARCLPQVADAVARRLRYRPSYWELVSMVELAANQRQQTVCEWFLRRSLDAPHDDWQGEATANNIDILCASSVPEFQEAAHWLRPIAAALRGRT
ncbi:MAG TPA: TRAFs-binding domain-containing protein [Myxococcaceae bacterium]|jgi:hypothetical protein